MAEGSAKDRPDCRDVLIVGAGPVGLTLANVLGAHGLTVDVVDQRDALIDYPRGVGLDDESLRGFQSIGLVHRVLPHTVPNQIMRFVNRKDQVIAEMRPTDTPYGWPRRNGFVQPLVDAELLTGLKRYPTVRVRWSSEMVHLQEKVDRVTATLATSGGEVAVDARFVVGADGGRSHTRKLVGIDFHGTTSPTRWLVIDVDNDPLGMPNTYVGADPRRPYVSISIAHGIRRFELMMHADEPDELAEDDGFIADMLRRFVPRPENLDIIRRRVYTHHSRIAGSFRKGRVFLAGDAAHLMPVWQGQGYNSGIRDAVNLGWKLAAVLRGFSDSTLLDSYDSERRDHAAAMIRLSTLVGRVISPTNTRTAFMRDQGLRLVSLVPQAKRYLLEMRFKPMPRYETGAVYHDGKGDRRTSPVGRLFIQPKVDTRADTDVLLDDVLGHWFSIVCWNNNPAAVLDTAAFDLWKGVGAKFFSIRPTSQLHWGGDDHAAVEIIGDRTGQLKAWFDAHRESVLFLRPDHCVAGASIAQEASTVAMSLGQRLSFVGVPT